MLIGFGSRPTLPRRRRCLHPNFDHHVGITTTIIYFVHYLIINYVQKHKIKIVEVKKNMGWRGRGGNRGWSGPWPGRGPFSNLPPWQRPGWVYGRGACWWLYNPNIQATTPPIPGQTTVPPTVPITTFAPAMTKEQEVQMLEQYAGNLEAQLTAIKKRLDELSR